MKWLIVSIILTLSLPVQAYDRVTCDSKLEAIFDVFKNDMEKTEEGLILREQVADAMRAVQETDNTAEIAARLMEVIAIKDQIYKMRLEVNSDLTKASGAAIEACHSALSSE